MITGKCDAQTNNSTVLEKPTIYEQGPIVIIMEKKTLISTFCTGEGRLDTYFEAHLFGSLGDQSAGSAPSRSQYDTNTAGTSFGRVVALPHFVMGN